MGHMQGIIGIFWHDNTGVYVRLLKGQRLFRHLKSFRIAPFQRRRQQILNHLRRPGKFGNQDIRYQRRGPVGLDRP